MIFDALHEAAQQGELLLVAGGLCRWHLCRDGHLTIREIVVLPAYQRTGIGRSMLRELCAVPGARSILARCPAHLEANAWYERCGFCCQGQERTRRGAIVNVWVRRLD